MQSVLNFRTYCQYIACNILGMIGLSCYILADTYFVARAMGSNGLAALNFAIPAYTLINATGLMLGIGGATHGALLRNKSGTDRTNRVFTMLLLAGLLLSLLFVGTGIFATPQLARLLGANGEALPLTIPYLRILLLYAPAFLSNQILLAFVRNDGNPQLAMCSMLTGSLANILLDYVFMFPLHMGMTGAAIATGCSPVLGIAVLSLHFLRKDHTLRLTRMPLYPKDVLCAIKLGISTWITELSSGVVLLVLNWIILDISGNLGVAAYGIVANIALVETAIYTGIGQGLQPLVSQAHGTQNWAILRKFALQTLVLCLALAAILYGALLLWTDPIIGIFNTQHNQALVPIAQAGIRQYFWGFFFAGINIPLAACLSAWGRPGSGFGISVTRGFLAILPLAILLSRWFSMHGVWLAFPLAEILTSLLAAILVKIAAKNHKR